MVFPQMDGDSSTTDASQLGITGEYMQSSHFVLQSQDGKDYYRVMHVVSSCFVFEGKRDRSDATGAIRY